MTSYTSFHPGSALEVFADLELHQKTPLPCTERDLTYNSSLLNENSKNELPKLLSEYSERNGESTTKSTKTARITKCQIIRVFRKKKVKSWNSGHLLGFNSCMS
jgi:hypothetical protein